MVAAYSGSGPRGSLRAEVTLDQRAAKLGVVRAPQLCEELVRLVDVAGHERRASARIHRLVDKGPSEVSRALFPPAL